MLALAQTLRAGLTQIAADNTLADDPSGDLTRAKLGTIFESEVVDQVVHLIDGSAVYVAPLASLPTGISFPPSVKNKVTYQGGLLQFAGAMTTTERNDLFGVSADTDYQAAVNDLYQQPQTLIQNTLSGLLDVNDAITHLADPDSVAELGARAGAAAMPAAP